MDDLEGLLANPLIRTGPSRPENRWPNPKRLAERLAEPSNGGDIPPADPSPPPRLHTKPRRQPSDRTRPPAFQRSRPRLFRASPSGGPPDTFARTTLNVPAPIASIPLRSEPSATAAPGVPPVTSPFPAGHRTPVHHYRHGLRPRPAGIRTFPHGSPLPPAPQGAYHSSTSVSPVAPPRCAFGTRNHPTPRPTRPSAATTNASELPTTTAGAQQRHPGPSRTKLPPQPPSTGHPKSSPTRHTVTTWGF